MNLWKGHHLNLHRGDEGLLESWINQQPPRTGDFQVFGPRNSENGIYREQEGMFRKEFYYGIINWGLRDGKTVTS